MNSNSAVNLLCGPNDDINYTIATAFLCKINIHSLCMPFSLYTKLNPMPLQSVSYHAVVAVDEDGVSGVAVQVVVIASPTQSAMAKTKFAKD